MIRIDFYKYIPMTYPKIIFEINHDCLVGLKNTLQQQFLNNDNIFSHLAIFKLDRKTCFGDRMKYAHAHCATPGSSGINLVHVTYQRTFTFNLYLGKSLKSSICSPV